MNGKPRDILINYQNLISDIENAKTLTTIDEILSNINLFFEIHKDCDLYFLLLIKLKKQKISIIETGKN
jgi:hypothetical protein